MSADSRGVPTPVIHLARFGLFELDFSRGSLRRDGRKVDLQQQSLLILTHLISNAGRLVSREELQAHVWPSGTFVEFELGLNAAINRLRRVLGDSAAEPRYIETVPKQGYRFICPVSLLSPHSGNTELPDRRETVRNPEAPSPASKSSGGSQPIPSQLETTTQPRKSPITSDKLSRDWGRPRFALVAALAGIVFGCSITYLLVRKGSSSTFSSPQIYRYTIPLPEGHWPKDLVLSPAGDQIVYETEYQGRSRLYRRYFDEDQSRPISGTENGHAPFFSPDGQQLGFYTPGELKVLNSSGTHTLARLSPAFDRWNAIWAEDGFVYFNAEIPGRKGWVWRISDRGGRPEKLLEVGQSGHGEIFSFPTQLLARKPPVLIYSTDSGPARRSLYGLNLKTLGSNQILDHGWGGLILRNGQLLYYRYGSVMVAPFDPVHLRITSAPTEVLTDVESRSWVGGKMTISRTGTLAYIKQPSPEPKQLEWVDLSGHGTALPLPPAHYEQAEVSPDGRKLAIVQREENSRWSLLISDLKTGSLTHLYDSTVSRLNVVWSPDSASLAISSERENGDFVNLVRVALAAPQLAERLTEQPNYGQFPQSWSSKANAILFMEGVHTDTNGDIMVLPLNRDGRSRPLVATPGWDRTPVFSPNGKWIVYESPQGTTPQIFAQQYDTQRVEMTGNRIQISTDGGRDPDFSPDGHTIYYVDADNHMMAVSWDSGNPLRVLPKHRLVFSETIPKANNLWTRPYSIAPDGRFLLLKTAGTQTPKFAHIQIIVNWFEELKRLTNVH